VWLRDQAVYVPPAGDQPGHWLGVFTDVSGEKRLEQELRETVSRFQTLLDQVPAVVYVDPVGREPIASQYVSPYIETLLGITPEQATTQPDWWVRALHPEDREAALRAADEVDRTGEPFRIEYRLVRPDGDVVWVHDEARLVRDDQGRPLCWQGVMFDITDRRRAEDDLRQALELERRAAERLREADELKDTFLTAVSHDLRTPLATILGIAVTLEQEGEVALAAEERRELLRSLAAGARRLAALVDDLLDLDRLRRGVTEPRVREESLDELVAECVDRLELGSDHPLELDLAPLRVPVDRAMVDRIVENLVTNVVRHTPRGTHLWVRLLPDARGGAILVVEDDGPGVPRELGEQVFDPFARGPSANPQSPGSGIGLSLVARFAQLHGGRAWVEERPGGGASFRVWLPGRRAAPD
jgi:PAS domain S-box-containing protein